MTIVPLLMFCSLALVLGAIVLFVFSAKQGDCHESERLCLMPLEDDAGPAPAGNRPDGEEPNSPPSP